MPASPARCVILVLGALTAVGFGALGCAVALRTGSGEAVQGLFPLFFVFIFLSSSNLPRNLLRTGWFHTVATWNPISYLIEAFRSLFIVGWDAHGAVARLRGRDGAAGHLAARRLGGAAHEDAAHMRSSHARHLARGAHDRVAQHPHLRAPPRPVRAVAGVPACVPGELRRRPVARSARAGLRLPRRLHGVPVRVRALPVLDVRRAVHRLQRSRSTSRAASRDG